MSWKQVRDYKNWKLWVLESDRNLSVSVTRRVAGFEVKAKFFKIARSLGTFKSVNDAVAKATEAMRLYDEGKGDEA